MGMELIFIIIIIIIIILCVFILDFVLQSKHLFNAFIFADTLWREQPTEM